MFLLEWRSKQEQNLTINFCLILIKIHPRKSFMIKPLIYNPGRKFQYEEVKQT